MERIKELEQCFVHYFMEFFTILITKFLVTNIQVYKGNFVVVLCNLRQILCQRQMTNYCIH